MSATTTPPHEPTILGAAIETMKVMSGILLLTFAEHGKGLRDAVARNFVARGIACLESIFLVWMHGAEQDAWILYRCLLDRLVHLHSLAERDDFVAFDDFSFRSMYDARQKLLSEPVLMQPKAIQKLKELQRLDRGRHDQLIAAKSRWSRPKAKDIFQQMEMGFLYWEGYDYASTHVHPTSRDGEADFSRLTSPTQSGPPPDPTVVSNAILAQTMLTQEALNASTMKWRAIVYNFLDHVRDFLRDGSIEYQVTFVKITAAGPDLSLCEPTRDTHGAKPPVEA